MTTTYYRRASHCVVYWDQGDLCALECEGPRLFRGADRYMGLLHHLDQWKTAGEVCSELSLGAEANVASLLNQLLGMGLVKAREGEADTVPENGHSAPNASTWNPIDLAMQRQTGQRGYNPADPPRGTGPPAFKTRPESPAIKLPPASDELSLPLGRAIDCRRTRRSYSGSPLSLDDLATFLQWSASRTTMAENGERQRFHRSYPSAGARYPLEIYPVVNAVNGLDAGAYYYDPRGHALHLVRDADERQSELNREIHWAAGTLLNREPPVVLLITAVFQRTLWQYDRLGLSLIFKDVGGLFQTMYLVATAMNLAPCAIGGGREAHNARWLRLDPLEESQVGCFLVGYPSTDTRSDHD